MTTETIGKPSFILVSDICGLTRSINLANITKIKTCDYLDPYTRKNYKNCIVIEVNQSYSIACEEKDNNGLLNFLHSLIYKDFRSKTEVASEMFDERGGIVW